MRACNWIAGGKYWMPEMPFFPNLIYLKGILRSKMGLIRDIIKYYEFFLFLRMYIYNSPLALQFM